MNRIRVKSGNFEIEIETDQPQTPKQMAEAIVDVVKAAPPSKAEIIEALPALPAQVAEAAPMEYTTESGKKKRKTQSAKDGEKPQSAEDVVDELVTEGKFDAPLGLKDVQEMIERMALPYSKPRIANALAALVRMKKLERIGPKGQFKYVRKGVQVQPLPDTNNTNNEASADSAETNPSLGEMTLEAAVAQAQSK